jgi:predicted Rossmann-fold nucleotide-binding protein
MINEQNSRKIIYEIEDISQLLAQRNSLSNKAIQGLNLSKLIIDWGAVDLQGTIFLGCKFAKPEDEYTVKCQGAYVFPQIDGLPYNPYRAKLYTWQELMEGYNPHNDQSLDYRIYQHFVAQGRYNPNIREALAQRIHDHAIDDALRDFLEFDEEGMTRKKGVGFMGGHSVLRTNPYFRKVAQIARLLTQQEFLVISGGGPGIMEAANFGAYMAETSDKEFDEAIQILCKVPFYKDAGYIDQSYEVLKHHPAGRESLAIPTWFYGHEPTNLFAAPIAKYFSNSIREDGLLAVSLFGVIYAPGSAGTTQEIFMDATQNHYGSFGYYSPMIFLGRQRYLKDTFLYPLVQQLAWGRKYAEMLFITDVPEEVVEFIKQHPPVKEE